MRPKFSKLFGSITVEFINLIIVYYFALKVSVHIGCVTNLGVSIAYLTAINTVLSCNMTAFMLLTHPPYFGRELANNPLTCDCRSAWLSAYLAERLPSTAPPTCRLPPPLRGAAIPTSQDLQCPGNTQQWNSSLANLHILIYEQRR